MHYFLCDDGCEPFLLDELRRCHPQSLHRQHAPRWVASDVPLSVATPPLLVFSRQCLPEAVEQEAPSIGAWSQALLTAVLGVLPEGQPWRLHIVPLYGEGSAGQHRCELIRESLRERLKKVRRVLLRSLEEGTAPLQAGHSLVQLFLTAPDQGLLSVAVSPLAFACRAVISSYPLGELPVAVDKAAPSRAFAKLVEAELRLGHAIQKGETVVDLGAAPGSWSYVALERGARVTAVDRSALREDLMQHPQLTFRATDAFKFKPDALPVDWLICDVIAAPERNIELLLEWVRERRARKFIVTVKFKGQAEYALLDVLKKELPAHCSELGITRLCANKNEACAFGVVR
jgi:23S rRNA (cytidine2498-2'-O)-methyltransferase